MFGKKLREIRKKHHLTMDELANKLNEKYDTKISKSMISRWESGQTDPSITNVKYLMQLFKVDYSYFIDDKPYNSSETDDERLHVSEPKFEYLSKHNKHIVHIPILGTIACGEPILAEQNIEGYTTELFDEEPDGTLFALKCQGDSMEPKIPNGATVIVREQPTVEDDEIAAVLVDDNEEATLKRIKHIGNQVMLMPENQKYDPIILNKENPGRILGKVIKVSYDL